MLTIMHCFFLLCVNVLMVTAQVCKTPSPPPADTFNLSSFWGNWYEIARIQTAGGNAIQQFCACTNLIYTPAANTNSSDLSNTDVTNSCRFETASGFWLNASSYLIDGGAEGGHWVETYCPPGLSGCPLASYNVIIEGNDTRGVPYFVEYDCSTSIIGESNYCLHFLSREPLGFDTNLLQALIYNTTVLMKLNPENRVVNITMQDEGCWN